MGIGACCCGARECTESGRNSNRRRANAEAADAAEAGRVDDGIGTRRGCAERESRRTSRRGCAAAQGARIRAATIEGRSIQSESGKGAQQSKRQAAHPTLGHPLRSLALLEEAEHLPGGV